MKVRYALFNNENAEQTARKILDSLCESIKYKHIQISTLGGKENVSILLTVSLDAQEDWSNGILHNSRYAMFHIENWGTVENFSGKLKDKAMRSFTTSDINKVIANINKQAI